jgi:hypothetical protein
MPAELVHDLKQPLFAMRLWLNLLEAEIGSGITAEARSRLAQLRAAVASMDAMISGHVAPKS